MENEENTDDTQVETQEGEQTVEEQTTEETPQEENKELKEEPKAEEGVKLSPAEYRHYLKWKNAPKDKPAQAQPATPQPNIEETVLLANGMPEELISELKAVATVRKTTLIKAQNDPIFVAVKEKFEKDQKQKDASLGASRRSGNLKPVKSFDTPGLTREEHRAMTLVNR